MSLPLLAIRIQAEPVRSQVSAAIGAPYLAIGTPFTEAVRILFIQNLTDATVMFSLDGVEDHFPLPSNGFLLLDVTSNATIPQGAFIAKGTVVYVKQEGAAPTSGAVYVSTFYGAGTSS